MHSMKRFGTLLLVSTLTALPPGLPTAQADDKASESPSLAVQDDRQRLAEMEKRGREVVEAKKTTPLKELISQLSRTSCDVERVEPGDEVLSSSEVYRRAAPGVLVMGSLYQCKKCPNLHLAPASGFVISESGVAVTNHHVVNQAERQALVAMTMDGDIYGVKEVLAASAADDVAVVQLDIPEELKDKKLTALPLSDPAPVGADVFVISHPDRRLYTLSRGTVSRYAVQYRARKKSTSMQITADYARGSSGAPVLDDKGGVVGIVSSTTSVYYTNEPGKPRENLQMVFKDTVPVEKLRNLLKKPETKTAQADTKDKSH